MRILPVFTAPVVACAALLKEGQTDLGENNCQSSTTCSYHGQVRNYQ